MDVLVAMPRRFDGWVLRADFQQRVRQRRLRGKGQSSYKPNEGVVGWDASTHFLAVKGPLTQHMHLTDEEYPSYRLTTSAEIQ